MIKCRFNIFKIGFEITFSSNFLNMVRDKFMGKFLSSLYIFIYRERFEPGTFWRIDIGISFLFSSPVTCNSLTHSFEAEKVLKSEKFPRNFPFSEKSI